jgi:hypothetical protein
MEFVSSNSDDFLPTPKNSKKNSKNIKFDFLQDFDTENILNGDFNTVHRCIRANHCILVLLYIYIEFGYDATRSTDGPCATDRFNIQYLLYEFLSIIEQKFIIFL